MTVVLGPVLTFLEITYSAIQNWLIVRNNKKGSLAFTMDDVPVIMNLLILRRDRHVSRVWMYSSPYICYIHR